MKKGLKLIIPILVVALLAAATCVSVFASEPNQAKIGDKEYATLEQAISAVNNGTVTDSTITLISDINGTVNSSIVADMALDLNGHSITSTNSDKTKSLFAVDANGVSFTLTGEGSITTNSRFGQISSDGDGSAFNIKGTGKGIVITTTGEGAMLNYLAGGGEIENTTLLCAGAVDDEKSAHIQLSGGLVSFNNCNIYSTAVNENMFYINEAGVQLTFDGCYVSCKARIFFGSYTSGLKNADDFVIVDAANSVFIADGGANIMSAVLYASASEPVQFSGVFNFNGCELAASRIFATGCDSGNSLPAGAFAEGYNLTVNVKDSTVRTLVNCSSTLVMRGFANFNFEDSYFNISSGSKAGFGGTPYSDPAKITIKNCYANRNLSGDNIFTTAETGLLARGYSWVLTSDNVKYPYFICETASKPTTGIPSAVIIQNGNTNNYFSSDNGAAAPLVGTSSTNVGKDDLDYGGQLSILLGRFEVVNDGTDAYFKYTYTKPDGTVPATPTDVDQNEETFFIIGDYTQKPTILYKNAEVIVTDVDIKTDNFGKSQINVIPQSRASTTATAVTANKNFGITNGKIGNISASAGAWHHIQLVIYVKKTEVAASGKNKAYPDYSDTYYKVYVDGKEVTLEDSHVIKNPLQDDYTYLKKDTSGNITGYTEPFYQGLRFFTAKQTSTAGGELCIDNLVIRSYASASSFVKNKFDTSDAYTKSGYSNVRDVAVFDGVKYTDVNSITANGKPINLLEVTNFKAAHDAVIIAPAGFGAGNITDSITTGYSDTKNGLFFGANTVWKAEKAETATVKAGTALTVYSPDGVKTVYYSHSKLSAIAAIDKDGIPYAGADTEQELGWLISGLADGYTARMQSDFTLSGDAITVSYSTKREVSFDLNGYTLSRTNKAVIFYEMKNVVFNLYSSRPGGVIASRNVMANGTKPSSSDYNFSTNSGAAVFYVKSPNAVVNIGAYGDFSGDNLTAYAAIFYDTNADGTGAECNVNGGTYVRYVHDSCAMFSTRADNCVINLKNANVLSTELGGASLLSILNGRKGTVNADGCTFYSQLKTDSSAVALFYNISYQGVARFTNCSFSNLALTNSNPEDTTGKTSGKVTLGAGNTYSESCDVSKVQYETGVTRATLKSGWKQTLVGGKTQLAFTDVIGVSSSKNGNFYYNTIPIYTYYDSTGKFIYAWTGGINTKDSAHPVPSGTFTTIYGNVNTPFNGNPSIGYTYDTASGLTYKKFDNGYENELVRTAYLVSNGEQGGIASGTNVLVMPNQKYVTLGASQTLSTYVLGDKTVTVARNAADSSAPEGYELPSSKAGVYSYTYETATETSGGVTYVTYTAALSIDFTLKSNISLNDSFVYNVFVPKTLVDAGDVETDVLINGAKVTLSETVTDGSNEYYAIYIDGITATRGGDAYEVVLTVNLAQDAPQGTASPKYIYSIPAYAAKLLETSENTAAKQMMADVLSYVKLTMDWAGVPYVNASGYADVASALDDYERAGITPTDTSAVDFAAKAKTPSADCVTDAVWAATFHLGSAVNMRFYLSETYTGTLTLTYKNLYSQNVSESFTVENGKCNGLNYVDLELKAYYAASDVTVSFEGQTDTTAATFNLASYISNCDDAEVLAVAKALYAYSQSALAYQNQ